MDTKKKNGLVFFALFFCLMSGVAAWVLPPGMNWIAVVILLGGTALILGYATTGRVFGTLINEQKLMSLSRFQMLVWTVLIVSAYLTIAMERVKNGDVVDPLIVGIDWQVWALLGISTTSLVGTPLLNSNKRSEEPRSDAGATPPSVVKAAATFGQSVSEVQDNRSGVMYGNPDINDARLSDMFEGEELSNAQLIDVGKLQMFFFTVIVAGVYAVELYQLIAKNLLTDDVSLPTVNEGLLGLMGASHVGYLGSKSITKTQTQ